MKTVSATVSGSPEVTFDGMAVANAQRRHLLVALLNHGASSEPLSEGELWSGDERDLTMRHAHLPKLTDYGFVRWDEDRGEVERGPAFAEIEPLVRLLVEHEAEHPVELA